MLSRTSARQQRMREQILNEERMSQNSTPVRASGERRSSGSKLIISSPTPVQSSGSSALPSSQNAPPNSNSRTTSQTPARGSGASALLAFLNGSHQRVTPTPSSINNYISGENESRSNHVAGEASIPNDTFSTPNRTQAASAAGASGLPVHSQQSKYHQHTVDVNKSAAFQDQVAQRPVSISYAPTNNGSQIHMGERNVVSGDRENMEMDANLSSVSSEMNSPMESCFANILEEQGSENIDLNSITPSIQFSTPIGNEFLHYPLQHAPNDRDAPHLSNQTQLGLRILQEHETDITTHGRQINPKFTEDDSPIKASASCPTDGPDASHHLGTSPLPLGSLGTQFGTSGSGGSLGGASGGTDGGSGSGTALLFTTVSPMGRSTDEQRAAWVRDRTKKDSHNRIERKRRDYINCQISELGNLLPEEMFRDGDCKKNKGSILKNSVEFICLLRAELTQFAEVRRETALAAKVISQLIKRIQYLEDMCGINQGPPPLDTGNLDYHRCLHEWLLLHERNTQTRSSLSPSIKSGYYQATEAGAQSSPRLSNLSTDEFLSADNKSVFSSPGLITGSAPAPGAPLTNCTRLHSPMPCGVLVGGPQSANTAESSSRMMRTRCISLNVTGNGNSGDFLSPTVRLPGLDFPQGQQAHVRQQRIIPSQSRPSQMTPPVLPEHSPQIGRGSAIHTPSSAQWNQAHAPHRPNQFAQHNSPFSKARHTQSRPVGVSMDQTIDGSGLSASLPVNVNPLLCGLQNHDDLKNNDIGLAHIYSFERDELVSHLKTEPPSDPDSQTGELSFPDSGPPTLDITTSQFEALVASVSPPSSSSRLAAMRNPHQQMMDSPITHPGCLDTDEFRFDDVAME